LYRRGRELLAQGLGGSVEFKEIASTLDLGDMLDRAPHMVSLFGDLSGEPPLYMQRRNSPANPDFNGWYSGRELQRRLDAAVAALPARGRAAASGVSEPRLGDGEARSWMGYYSNCRRR
jgi:hypothetical protein